MLLEVKSSPGTPEYYWREKKPYSEKRTRLLGRNKFLIFRGTPYQSIFCFSAQVGHFKLGQQIKYFNICSLYAPDEELVYVNNLGTNSEKTIYHPKAASSRGIYSSSGSIFLPWPESTVSFCTPI